jgi:murein L,D-transpeptidase YcbB/YkuD
MPNPYEVYLHGTPAARLFDRSRRDLSHGCVRVEDPTALATWALAQTPGWSADHVRAAVAAGESEVAALQTPLQVLILYATAVVGEDGRVSFFRDLYGKDAVLEKALVHVGGARRAKGAPAFLLRAAALGGPGAAIP